MKKHSERPKISIIVPNYNHSRFLPERLQSILAQTYQDFELIILDDASTDNSLEVISECLADAPHRLFVNETNSGSAFRQWALGMTYAIGDLIWLAESDDVADPLFLETLLPLFDDLSVGLAYSQSSYIDESSQVIGSAKAWSDDLSPSLWSGSFRVDGKFLLASYLLVKNIIPNASAVLFRRTLFEDVARLHPRLRLVGDWILWATIASQAAVCFVSTSLNQFRSHNANVRVDCSIDVRLEHVKATDYVANLCLGKSLHCELMQARSKLLIFWYNLGIFDLPFDSQARQAAFRLLRRLYGLQVLIPILSLSSQRSLFRLKSLVGLQRVRNKVKRLFLA